MAGLTMLMEDLTIWREGRVGRCLRHLCFFNTEAPSALHRGGFTEGHRGVCVVFFFVCVDSLLRDTEEALRFFGKLRAGWVHGRDCGAGAGCF